MGAFRRVREGEPPRRPLTVGAAVGQAVWLLYRLGLSVTVIALGAALVLYILLLRGPISIPGAAGWAETEIRERLDGQRVAIGDVVLALGEGGAPSGIQLRDVHVASAAGAPVFQVRLLSGRFALADLLQGRLKPIEIVLSGVEARLIRRPGDGFLFGLGHDGGVALEEGASEAGDATDTAAVTALLDGFAGGAGVMPEGLERLERVRVIEADLAYVDARTGATWTGERASLELWRAGGGARLRLVADVGPAAGSGGAARHPATRIVIEGARKIGETSSRIHLALSHARPREIAGQFAALEWLELIDAPLDGELDAVLRDDGGLHTLGGRITAHEGRVAAIAGSALGIDKLEVTFRLDETLERLWFDRVEIAGARVAASVSGFLDLERDPGGALAALVTQVDVTTLDLDLPDVFDRRLAFDAGRITARLWLERMRFEIAEARLSRGDLAIEASGRASAGGAGWRTDLRVVARNLTVADLVAHWPLIAAESPRRWIAERVEEGVIDELVANVRIGRGEPQVTMDFRLRDAVAHYVPGMPPLQAEAARGHLAGERFALALEAGQVTPAGGGALRLDGSTFAIPDVSAEIPAGEVALALEGGLGDALALIDTEPLGLLSRLGADLGAPRGSARVAAAVAFPLLADLPVGDVRADVEATLSGLSLAPLLGGAGRLPVTAEQVTLAADDRGMRIAGRVVLEGIGVDLVWSEGFGDTRSRTVTLEGGLGREALVALAPGVGTVLRDGRVPARIELRQTGSDSAAFSLRADLGPAVLAAPALRWTKPAGSAGRLEAEGRIGERLQVGGFRVTAGDLSAEGALALTAEGDLDRLTVERLVLGDRADLGLEVWLDRAGAMRASATGRRLDLTELIAEGSGEPGGGPPIRAEVAIDRLYLSKNLVLTAATGEYLRTTDGRAQARVEGRVGGSGAVVLDYSGGGGRDERVTVTSEDAGAVLAGGGYFQGGSGGKMRLEALLSPTPGVAAQGLLRVRDMRVSQAPTLSAMLESGDAKDLSSEVSAGGLAFDEIEVPFVYGEGTVHLSDVIATSPSLAVKLEGTYDEGADAIDLHGVISPAYALTGALNQIPLLGVLLSGGEGEGIFAMTFTVEGAAAAPAFEVQPLSLLAPGILRRIFSGTGSEGALPAEEFMRRIERTDR